MEQCRAAAGDNVLFTGRIANDDPLLMSAFAGAKTLVLPSFSEVMPQVLYQGALAGCALIVSKNVPSSAGGVRKYIDKIDPRKPKDIRRAIEQAMTSQVDPGLREAVMNMDDWQGIADHILGIYKTLLK